MNNLLMISIDDLADIETLKSLYDGPLSTPNLDRLMESGTTFANAFSQAPVCNASRASALSGETPLTTGVFDNMAPWDQVVSLDKYLPSTLRDAGHHVATGGKVFHGTTMDPDTAEALFDEVLPVAGQDNGRFMFDGTGALTAEEVGFDPEQLTDVDMANEASAFLQSYDGDAPFSLLMGFLKPHASWHVPQEFFDLYDLEAIQLPETQPGDLNDIPAVALRFVPDFHQSVENADVWPEYIRGYLASVSYVDAQLGKVLDALEASEHADDTAIVLWSDHGYHLGDRELAWEKFTLWEEATRAPLIVVDPDRPDSAGQVVDAPVELLDMAPTIADLVGVDAPDHYEGSSLVPFLEDPDRAADRPAMSWVQSNLSVRDEQYRYSRYIDGSEELYDLEADPKQFDNLADDPAYESVKAELFAAAVAREGLTLAGDAPVEGTSGRTVYLDFEDDAQLVGGDGNDVYILEDLTSQGVIRSNQIDKIVEADDGGIDTLHLRGARAFEVPRNIEIIHLDSRRGEILEGDGVRGGPGDHSVYTGQATEVVLLGDGDDYLHSRGGGDLGRLGAGDDEALVAVGVATVHGGAGDDTLTGRNGDQTFFGSLGDDQLFGGFGADTLDGGHGDDVVHGQGGNDRAFGGAGNDVVTGGSGRDRVEGGQGDDRVEGGFSDDRVGGGAGDDIVRGDGGNDQVYGGAGDDEVDGGDGDDVMLGGAGDDVMIGGRGNDVIDGGAGIDTLDYSAIAGAIDLDADGVATFLGFTQRLSNIETLLGGTGGDTLSSASLSPGGALRGGLGDDTLTGGADADALFGDAGDDAIDGGAGADAIRGGDGADRLTGGADDDSLWGDFGEDMLFGGLGADFLRGGADADELHGEADDDFLDGQLGDDLLLGGVGDDVLHGRGGDDWLRGGGDDDRLDGGAGDDRLAGGAGADIFVYATLDAGTDVIVDFEDGVDRIGVSSDLGIALSAVDVSAGVDGAIVTIGGGVVTLSGVDASVVGLDDLTLL